MFIISAVLVSLGTALPLLPLYTDEEAAVFAARAEKLRADIDAKRVEPAEFDATLRELKIDRHRLRVLLPETRDVMLSDEYRLSDGFVLIRTPYGRVAIFQRKKWHPDSRAEPGGVWSSGDS